MSPKYVWPPVIGLAGPGGVGKSTVARALARLWIEDHPDAQGVPAILSVAAPIKAMLAAFYAEVGVPDREIREKLDGRLKRTSCPLLGGHSPTHALQTLGTEWGRERLHSDIWLDLWRSRAQDALGRGLLVMNDSVRFENEAQAVQDLGGVVVRLTARQSDLATVHASEIGVSGDFDIPNGRTPAMVARAVLEVAGNRLSSCPE